jgi:hypothetical protein
MTYIQPIPPGATEIRASSDLEETRGRRHHGIHDLQQEMAFTLQQGSPVRLSFQWAGGLEAYTEIQPGLSPGARSGGIRVLDFREVGEGWILSLEGDGGTAGSVRLLGASVFAEDEGAEVRPEAEGRWVLSVRFPHGEPRAVRTIHLVPATPDR